MFDRNRYYLVDNKLELPIDKYKREILYSLEKHNILIIAGETGSGKSTRLPQIIYSSGIYNHDHDSKNENPYMLCVTQPRRVAAMQLAHRVSNDLNCNLGSTIGYAVRFDDVTTKGETMIKFMTEGLLLREMMFDPLLNMYSVLIVDEVHERNLNTDLLLGLLKCLLLKRPKLKLLICSATLDIDHLCKFFTYDNLQLKELGLDSNLYKPAVVCIPGKTFPIKVFYTEQPASNYLDLSIQTVIDIHESNRLESGKILVFLTGQDEVDYVCERLNQYAETSSSRLDIKNLMALPLHSSLKPEEISRVFDEYGRNTRLCIVSTNIAETSITINDIAFVIDCGFVKLRFYDSKTGIDTLIRVPISKSSAKQRAGRAGRTREGVVYRLYQEEEYKRLSDYTTPEIQRSSLLEVVLLMKSLGVENLQRFSLLSHMPKENLTSALEHLYALQVIDDTGNLTNIGIKVAQFNLDPRLSKIFLSPKATRCTIEICKIIAMLQVKEIYTKQGKYCNDLWSNTKLTNICASEGDLLSYLNIINGFIDNNKNQNWADKRNLNYQALLNATEIFTKLQSQLAKCGIKLLSCNGSVEVIRHSLLDGLFLNAAYLQPNGDYKTVRGEQIVHIHPKSVFSEMIDKPKYVIFVELLNTTKLYMRHIMAIESNMLLEAAPQYYTFATELELMRRK